MLFRSARKLEADRLKKEEEAALKKQLGKKEAKAEAERRLQQRYYAIEQQVTSLLPYFCSESLL